MKREPTLIYSSMNGPFTKDGMTVEVSIISSDMDPTWSLEVINSSGTSIVWNGQFESDDQAYAAFKLVVDEEGMQAFQDEAERSNVIPFPRRH